MTSPLHPPTRTSLAEIAELAEQKVGKRSAPDDTDADAPPPQPPILDPRTAAKLLEGVVYDRVLECIDLETLFDFERDLWYALEDCGIEDEGQILQLAKELIDRALYRVREDPRRYVNLPREHCRRGAPDCVDSANEPAKE